MYSTIKSLLLITTVALSTSVLGQGVATINPSKDNTIIESSTGSLSNGSGAIFHSGTTAGSPSGKIRRGLLEFDVVGNLPAGATVDSVVLKVTVNKVKSATSRTHTLHTVDAEWGEGTSTNNSTGAGASSASGDATWKHSSYSGTDWSTLGGDYNSTASASTSIGNTGTYVFTSTAMKNDVQAWVNNPSSNHGWIMLGDESTTQTVKVFNSREASTGKPELIVYYTCSKSSFTSSGNCLNSPVNFTNTSTNAVSYRWDFDNNGTVDDTTKNPSHIFSTSGFKTVELVTYSSAGCKDSTTRSILIFGLPTASFSADTVCSGDSTTLTSDFVGSRYEWDFDADGLFDTIVVGNPSIKHVFSLSGLVDVRFRYTDNNGCKNETLQKILIPIKPFANFKSDVVCGKSVTNFQNQSASASSSNIFRWDFNGDGLTDTITNNFTAVQYRFPSGGTKPVRLVIETNNGCLDTLIKNAVVDTVPLINLDVDTVCVGVITQINDVSTHVQAGSSYKWDYDNDGAFDNFSAGNKSINFPNIGSNLFKLVIENPNGCKDSITDTAVVTQGITVDFTADTVCIGSATSFTDNSTITSSVNYRWDFDNDGTVDDNTEGNNTHTYTADGIYTVKLAISDAAGCKDSTTIDVEVLALPDVDFTADTVCLGSATSFTDNTTVGFGPTYRWDFEDDGIIDNGFPGNVTHTYPTGGEKTTKLTVTSIFGCKDSTSVDILVKTKPVSSFTVTEDDPDVILTNNSTGSINSFEWDFGDGNTDNTNASLTYTYADNGTYTICLTSTNECGDSVICDDVTITGISVSNIVLLEAFTLAPNPFANSINVISNATYSYSVNITDVQGRAIYSADKVNGNSKIDLSEYNKGIYFITISTEIGTITHKIVKSE